MARLEAIRCVLADAPENELRALVCDNDCAVYGFDRDKVEEAAQRVGPTLSELKAPLTQVPPDSLLPRRATTTLASMCPP